ncbi:MAG: tryptophan synthase subunit alpha [Thaumarchaeota archaeon]|nr:tryptophan synthase subunit alpha [Nitrososphaerota archaeon]
MSRIQNKFSELESARQHALVTYVMAGYPSHKDTLSAVRGLIQGGADIIELGFPFSDPLADGPVIQHASTISLEKGTKMAQFLNLVKQIRAESQIPLVLMTYTNILYHKGYDKFFKLAKEAGLDGIITPDMTVEESKEYLKAAKKHHLDTIFLVSPNTSPSRLSEIVKQTSGFLYLVSVFGTTGVQNKIQKYTIDALRNTKKTAKGKVPVGIGFGISTPQDIKDYIKSGADAVIVGSALIKLIEKTPSKKIQSVVATFTRQLKSATK